MSRMVWPGDVVQWDSGRKPLGTVVQTFKHQGFSYAVVQKDTAQPHGLSIVLVGDNLRVVPVCHECDGGLMVRAAGNLKCDRCGVRATAANGK